MGTRRPEFVTPVKGQRLIADACHMQTTVERAPVAPLQVPQLAALYHNDCLHVANELLTLPIAFAGPLKAVTGGIPPDFIPEVSACLTQSKRFEAVNQQ